MCYSDKIVPQSSHFLLIMQLNMTIYNIRANSFFYADARFDKTINSIHGGKRLSRDRQNPNCNSYRLIRFNLEYR